MLKQFKFGILAAFAVVALASCKNDSSATTDPAATDAATASASGALTPPAAQAAPGVVTDPNVVPTANVTTPAPPVGPTTAMTFAEPTFDFGKVKAGEKVRHEYKFRNTGKEPLIISNAKGSCGCTVPQWPKEPIPVGGQGAITVEFDSKNKTGNQTKTVTVTANTDPAQTMIYIKGEVEGDPKQPTVTPANPSGK